MRLQPIENPKSLFLKLVYFFTKKQYGKVITPLKVIYARSWPLLFFGLNIVKTENKLSVPKETRILIRYFIAQLNDCQFCSNLLAYMGQKDNPEFKKTMDWLQFRTNPQFSDKEKAVLTYAEEASLTKKVSDGTFESLKKYYNEREIVEIAWLCAIENYYNIMNKPMQIGSDGL